MTKEQVIELLEFYPRIGDEIKMYSEMLERIEESWGVNGVRYDGSVRSSAIADTTAVKAEKLAESAEGDVMREIEKHITYLKNLQTEIFSEFKKLPFYQKQVIYYYYLDGERWAWIAGKLKYSERQCKRYREQGLNILCTAFNVNKTIQPINSDKYNVI